MEMEVSLIQAFTPRQVTMGQPGGHHCIAFALKRVARPARLENLGGVGQGGVLELGREGPEDEGGEGFLEEGVGRRKQDP